MLLTVTCASLPPHPHAESVRGDINRQQFQGMSTRKEIQLTLFSLAGTQTPGGQPRLDRHSGDTQPEVISSQHSPSACPQSLVSHL